MSGNYIPLYRKYRPQTLDTLVGQEHIKKALTSAIELGRISHAFLFTGPRGTGKTSTARILAKSLNCVNGPTTHPCGECESCTDITNTVPIDVIEIDAASNRKVEDAQNILEKIQYVPVHGKYKIYIIDEVHMLSNTAFNALLKTLEEPPENVIFILATTEVHKVLDTIKSRCQRYDFRRITTEDIVKHLRYISNEEKINISDDALLAIAKNSAGGMRDSISLLDQLSLLGVSKEITSDDVSAILGRISFDVLYSLSEKIISSSPNDAIEIINDIYNSGNEPLQILTNLSEYFKNLLVVKTCKQGLHAELTGLNEPQIELINKQKDLLEVQQLVFLIERISYYIKEVKTASNQHLWLEVGIIDLANMTENTTLIDLQKRVKALEAGGIPSGNFSTAGPIEVKNTTVTRPSPVHSEVKSETKHTTDKTEPAKNNTHNSTSELNLSDAQASSATKDSDTLTQANTPDSFTPDVFTPPPMSKKADGKDLATLWGALLANIKSAPTKALLNQMGTPVKITPEEIIITFKTEGFVSQYTNTNKKDMLVEASKALFNNADTKIIVRLPKAGDETLHQASAVSLSASVNKENKEVESEKKKINNNQANISESKESLPHDSLPHDDLPLDKLPLKRLESDQEKMILDLFDGKYID